MWSALPGRETVVRGYELLGQPLPWLPLSLTPYETMTSALWLLPPLAIIAAILRLGAYRELWLAIVLGLAAFAGVLLGVLQVTSGDVLNSPWYLYAVTNNGMATGFFANSNHMATLLIVTIPFMVALLGVKRSGRRYVQQDAGRYAILGGAILILLLGLALNPSTAGIGLGIAVVGGIAADPRHRLASAGRGGDSVAVALLGLAAVVAIFTTPLESSFAAAGTDQSYSTRATSFGNSLRAVADTFPVGSGSGSFDSVYPAYENPTSSTAGSRQPCPQRLYRTGARNRPCRLAADPGVPVVVGRPRDRHLAGADHRSFRARRKRRQRRDPGAQPGRFPAPHEQQDRPIIF